MKIKPYYEDNHIRIYNKDCRDMSELADNSVQCVVTSPPYWGLRKYSGEQELIWGDNHCEHKWQENTHMHNWERNQSPKLGISGDASASASGYQKSNFCSLCGAWKGAYGLEPTPEMYIEHTIEILREIRRVLRQDGVVFWNIGDSYSPSSTHKAKVPRGGMNQRGREIRNDMNFDQGNLKPKDLCLIPFRVAIAAQEDGWWVRSVIIWSKPNPMPESVTDRPTESHEYILLLTKSARYYWDADAVREPHTRLWDESNAGSMAHPVPTELHGVTGYAHSGKYPLPNPAGRNIRSVWEFPTQPYPEAHFAVFPEKLPEICIKAATPEVGCCSKCGAPWGRIIHNPTITGFNITAEEQAQAVEIGLTNHSSSRRLSGLNKKPAYAKTYRGETLGWQPTCKCNADKVPSIVLDPFAGAGTTLWVAKKLNRRAVGYEISKEYCDLALDRNRQQVFL